MRLIDADKLSADMYHEAFEKDSDMQKWDSGCWIRYKMFENVLKAQPTVEPEVISKWKKEFREYVDSLDIARDDWKGIIEYIDELPSIQPEPHWVPCSERLPEEHEWIGTKHFGTTISDEVYVTFEVPDGQRFADHISFQNGKLSRSDEHRMKVVFKGAKPIAWQPCPEPYQEGGEQDG